MNKLFYVFLGAGTGGLFRYWVGTQTTRLLGIGGGPFGSATGTFVINVLGGLLMGGLVGYLAHRGGADAERLRLLLAVGLLGGFTTFSAFSLDAALMIEKRLYGVALSYIAASVLLSVGGLFIGLIAARRVFA
jgi:CrcB protein